MSADSSLLTVTPPQVHWLYSCTNIRFGQGSSAPPRFQPSCTDAGLAFRCRTQQIFWFCTLNQRPGILKLKLPNNPKRSRRGFFFYIGLNILSCAEHMKINSSNQIPHQHTQTSPPPYIRDQQANNYLILN